MLRLYRAALGAALICVAAAVPGPSLRAQDSAAVKTADSVAWARVSYLSGASVYVDAGARAGLREGSRLQVIRSGRTVATLVVAFISSRSASCTVTESAESPIVGDSVRFTPVIAAASPEVLAATPTGATSSSRVRSPRNRPLRGRVGLRYFSADVSDIPNGAYTQPAIDARLDGQRLGGTPFGITVDVRAHRTRRPAAPGDTTRPTTTTRVYQAAVHLDGASSPARLTLGRQFSTAISPIGLFDGVAADINWRHTGAGAFAGTQPDPFDFGLSKETREYGAWFQLHSAPGGASVWSLTTGAVGSYVQGNVNREFLYLQGLFVNRALSVYAAQELDYNRGWKTDAGEPVTTPTSSYATVRLSLGEALSVSGGVDSRRNVRLYRDFLNPEVEFDDTFRKGAWAGTSLWLGRHVYTSVDVRSSDGGASGKTGSRTVALNAVRLTPLGLAVRGRATRYEGDILAGTLSSVSLEMSPSGAFRLEVNGGARNDQRTLLESTMTRLTWYGATADLGIGRSWYASLSTHRERNGGATLVQTYASLTWRF
jgi:hypothetical protein